MNKNEDDYYRKFGIRHIEHKYEEFVPQFSFMSSVPFNSSRYMDREVRLVSIVQIEHAKLMTLLENAEIGTPPKNPAARKAYEEYLFMRKLADE